MVNFFVGTFIDNENGMHYWINIFSVNFRTQSHYGLWNMITSCKQPIMLWQFLNRASSTNAIQ